MLIATRALGDTAAAQTELIVRNTQDLTAWQGHPIQGKVEKIPAHPSAARATRTAPCWVMQPNSAYAPAMAIFSL